MKRSVLLGGSLALGMVTVGLGTAAAVTVTGEIVACQSNSDFLRLAEDGECRDGEAEVRWNVQGPRGEQGDPGPVGPAGPPGAQGEPGADGQDAGPVSRWYVDRDGDGHGDWYAHVWAATQPTGHVADNDDCNDWDARAFPGSTAEGIPATAPGGEHLGDMDCDGHRPDQPDDAGDAAPDSDGDGHAWLLDGGDDCDDADATRFPGNSEVSDPADHDEDCSPLTGARPRYDALHDDPRLAGRAGSDRQYG